MRDIRPESSRYQLQKNYQPNIIKSWAAVIVLVAGLAIYASSWDEGELVRLDLDQACLPEDFRFVSEKVKRSSEIEAIRSVGEFNSQAYEYEGFLGFNIKVIKEEQAPIISIDIPPVYTPDEKNDLQASDVSFSVIEGEGKGVYVPDGAEYDFATDFSNNIYKPTVNRSATLVRSVKPEVPWIARENDKEGCVEILVLIDKTGQPIPYSCQQADDQDTPPEYVYDCRLKDGSRASLEFFIAPKSGDNKLVYVVLREEPKDYYFADKLIEKLPEWRFAPAIQNNQPVDQFIIIQFRYCDPTDVNCQAIILAGSAM